MQKLQEITNNQKPGHFCKFKKNLLGRKFLGRKRGPVWGKEVAWLP
jgi:hypothetical protein